MDDGRIKEIEPSPAVQADTATSPAPKPTRRRSPNVTAVSVLAAFFGALMFAAGLFAISHPIVGDPTMGFFVEGDHGQPLPSTFPAQRGLFCETPLMTFGFYPTCGSVDPSEFAPNIPTFAADETFDVSLVNCHAVAFRAEGKQYTTAEFDRLNPLDAAAPWILVFGFFLIASATFFLAPHKALVVVPTVVLPVLVVVAYISGAGGSFCI
jgi:hypothetical protein